MKNRRNRLVIVPLGEVDYFLLNKLATNISTTLALTSNILQGDKIPPESYNVARAQYFSTVILQKLEIKKSRPKEIILGVLEEDIYNANGHYLVSDCDQLTGAGLISLFHIRSDFYGLPENEKLVYPRLYKETFKLICMLLGLRACRNPQCVMYYSEELRDIDEKRQKLCDICQREFIKLI